MQMETWYDLRIQELLDLADRVNDLLSEVEGAGEDVGPAPPVRERSDLADRVSDLLGKIRGGK